MIKRLYEGKICPVEEKMPENPAYREAEDKALVLEEQLYRSLSQEQREMYDELKEAESAEHEIRMEESFCQGYRIGTRLLLDALGLYEEKEE